MKKEKYDIVYYLSIIIIILMSAASLSGIFFTDIYQDNILVQSAWEGNDIITMVLAVPIFLNGLMLYKKKTVVGILVLFAMLFYSLYNYAFYLFSAAFNSLFLIYVTIFALSIFAILLLIRKLDVEKAAEKFKPETPFKLIGWYMIIAGILVGAFHIGLSFIYVISGNVPQIITNVAHPTNVIAALNLSMVVPVALIAGINILKKRAWGFVLALVWNLKVFVYMTALSSASIVTYINGAVQDLYQLVFWGPIGIGCFVMTYILFKNIRFHNK
ncbi:MAG: hypothetical protein R6V14_01130 [Halanaerobiales bacterium]